MEVSGGAPNTTVTVRDKAEYPIKGARFLLGHPRLLASVMCWVLLGALFSLIALIVLLAATLKPQAIAFGGSTLGWLLATIAVFTEALLIAIIFMKIVVSRAQEVLFVKVMKLKKEWDESWEEPTMLKGMLCCCNATLLLQILTLPLNLIPVIGTMAYVYVNAPLASWDFIGLYYDAMGMSDSEQRLKVVGRGCEKLHPSRALGEDHFRFGMACVFLELMPLVGPTFFSMGNACGAALWACDMQREVRTDKEGEMRVV